MIAVLQETTDCCAVCGEVACESDLLIVETDDEAVDLDVEVGDYVCTDCVKEVL